MKTVLDSKPPIEISSDIAFLHMDRGPDLTNSIKAAFLFMIGSQDAIRGMVAIGIKLTGVSAPDRFIGKNPQESAGSQGMLPHT